MVWRSKLLFLQTDKNFILMTEKNIQDLLDEINIIRLENETIIKATSGRFNIFGLLGVDHYEVKHSKILAEFLDPKGSHGLDELFLQAFVKQFLPDFEFDCKNAKVITEKYIGEYGRIDIIIEQEAKAIIIENKIYAKDQEEQLKRYENYVKNKNIEYQILYLTLNGEKADEKSGKDVGYKTISYKTDIIKWLEECAKISIERAIVRETITQYVRHLKQLTEQDMDTKNQKEIVELLTKNNHNINAVITILHNKDAWVKEIINTLITPIFQEIANEHKLKIIEKKIDNSSCTFSFSFSLKKDNWKQWNIFMKWDNNRPYYGITGSVKWDETREYKGILNYPEIKHDKQTPTEWWNYGAGCFTKFNQTGYSLLVQIIEKKEKFKEYINKVVTFLLHEIEEKQIVM